jgi:hypothetical protein
MTQMNTNQFVIIAYIADMTLTKLRTPTPTPMCEVGRLFVSIHVICGRYLLVTEMGDAHVES